MKKRTRLLQKLESYTDAYVAYKGWLKKETAHYIFHYTKNSHAEKNILKIAASQEAAFTAITKSLSLKLPKRKIRYYLYPDQATKKQLMGSFGYAQSIYHDRSIHAVYSKSVDPLGPHEDTHILTLSLGLPIGFIQEGLAEYMAGNRKWEGKDQGFWIKKGIREGVFPPIKTMMSHRAWLESPDEQATYYYLYAKQFVRLLIKDSGIEKFKKLYRKLSRLNTKKENIAILESLYSKRIDDIDKELMESMDVAAGHVGTVRKIR